MPYLHFYITFLKNLNDKKSVVLMFIINWDDVIVISIMNTFVSNHL